MILLLLWVPLGTSLVLGTVFVFFGDAPPAVKLAGLLVFVLAVYLQYFAGHPLAGLLLQVALALALAFWWKSQSTG